VPGSAGSVPVMSAFSDRLVEAVARKRSQLVVGLDPVPERLPPELRGEAGPDRGRAAAACEAFSRGIVDAVAPFAVAVKPQSAFFEALGPAGVAAYAAVCDHARAAGLLVIADAKRGDIGSTARAYAAAFVEPRDGAPPLADAVTVNPYMGRDSVEPFLDACEQHGGGIFCLVKTSNPGGADVQDLVLADGRPLWQQVARLVDEWGAGLVGERGLSVVGAVVGATYPREVAEARRPADLEPAFAAGPASALVNASRSVIYAHERGGDDWRAAAAAEAERLASEIWGVSGW